MLARVSLRMTNQDGAQSCAPTDSCLKTFHIKSGCRSNTAKIEADHAAKDPPAPNEDQSATDATTGGRPFGRTHHTKVTDGFNLSAVQSCDYLNAASATDCIAAVVHLSGTAQTHALSANRLVCLSANPLICW